MRISGLGEFGLIDLLAKGAPGSPQVIAGIGDDTAVIATEPGRDILLTCDMLYEGVHFRRGWYEGRPGLLGRKALGANISDIAGKGGRPRFCLVTLGAEADLCAGFLRGVYDGLYALARECGISVVGGDTVGIPGGLLLDVFLVGEVQPGGARLRSAAKPGDLIAVTGEFGMARAGLELLDHQLSGGSSGFAGSGDLAAEACLRQLATPVRLGEALALQECAPPHAMTDTSDGLADQVHHICRSSGVGAVVDAAAVPVGLATWAIAAWAGCDALEWALWGGEDYELMLTVPPGRLDGAERAVAGLGATRLTVVGEITADPAVQLAHPGRAPVPLAFGGYNHFLPGDPAAYGRPVAPVGRSPTGPGNARRRPGTDR